jgi:hypothetical protein
MFCSNRIIAVILTCLLGTFSGGNAHAETHLCTIAEGRRALDEADTFRSWEALYRSYKKFGHCDDGAIGEGYSESVARILADHWSSLPRLAQLAGKDAAFREFAIRHLDATLNTDDLERIKKSATSRCRHDLQKTCSEIATQADYALKLASSP